MKILSLVIVLLVAVSTLAGGAEKARTPKPGSPERKAVLDALRQPLEEKLGFRVIFRVRHLKVLDGWAFMKGQARTAEDRAIDFSRTSFAEEAERADELLVAVLRKKGKGWEVVDHALFTTDVWWHGIHEKLGAPVEIFDYGLQDGGN